MSNLVSITHDVFVFDPVYVMTGGGLSKKGQMDPRRFRIARLSLASGAIESGVALDMLPWMKKLARDLDGDAEKARDLDGEKVKIVEDFKSEGLAVDPKGRLLLGLRKPLIKGKSAVVELAGYREAFERADPERVKPRVVDLLDLSGGGISSLEWDPVHRTMLVLSIESSKHRTDVWTWDFDRLDHRARLRGHKAEGIGRMGRTGKVLLLADDEDPDGSKHGRSALLEL
jgi:hypothetical protein